MSKTADEKKRTESLRQFMEFHPQPKGFQEMIGKQVLSKMALDHDGGIQETKKLFLLACLLHNDEAGAYLLNLLFRLYQTEAKILAESPNGDGHLGNASRRAHRQLCDLLMKMYFELPDRRIEKEWNADKRGYVDKSHPVLTQTKFLILEQTAKDWQSATGWVCTPIEIA